MIQNNKTIFGVVLAVGLLLFGVSGVFDVWAAKVSNFKDTLEDSRPSTDSNHEIQFVTSSGVATGETIILKFDDATDNFTISGSLDFSDLDLAEDTDGTPGDCSGTLTDKTLAATATATDWGVGVNTTTDEITLTAPSSGTPIAAGACLIIEIGDNATSGATGDAYIQNPATASIYDIDVAGTMTDSGNTKVVVIDTITASVTIDESLSVTVAGETAANCNFGAGTGDIDTTATSIPFGTAAGNTFVDGCQNITVSTNSSGGYNATIIQSDQLTSGSDQILDGNCDGACDETTLATWATATNNGFAYCLEDITGTSTGFIAGSQCNDTTPEFKIMSDLSDSETPETIMSATAPVSGDEINVGFRLSVPGDQAAGTYTNNIIYVVTPVY